MLKAIQTDCEIAKKERNNLAIQKLSLLRFISDFKDKNKNDVYMRLERFVQDKVNTILRNNMKLLELSLVSALKAFRNDPNVYRYLFHKLDQTTTSELIAAAGPNTTLFPYYQRANIGLVRANNYNNNNSTLNSHGQADLLYHVQTQRPGDFCYACYDYDAEGISRKYFENLGKEIISEIGLDSFEGLYTASHAGTDRSYL